jgi:hypothetical protein
VCALIRVKLDEKSELSEMARTLIKTNPIFVAPYDNVDGVDFDDVDAMSMMMKKVNVESGSMTKNRKILKRKSC